MLALRIVLTTILLSTRVVDFVCTRYLLLSMPQDATEANPLANAVLQSFGWFGLAIYVAAGAMSATVVFWYACAKRPATGYVGLAIATGVSFGVACYQMCLLSI